MVEPKQKPAGKPVHTADKARIPRTAMRAAWLRTREGTRRLTAGEQQDGHYREAASLEERAVDTAVSARRLPLGPPCAAAKGWRSKSRKSDRRKKQPVRPNKRQSRQRVQQLGRQPLCRLNRAIEAPEFYLIIIRRIGKASLRGDNPHRLPRRWVWIVCAGGNPSISTRAACAMIRRHVFR